MFPIFSDFITPLQSDLLHADSTVNQILYNTLSKAVDNSLAIFDIDKAFDKV